MTETNLTMKKSAGQAPSKGHTQKKSKFPCIFPIFINFTGFWFTLEFCLPIRLTRQTEFFVERKNFWANVLICGKMWLKQSCHWKDFFRKDFSKGFMKYKNILYKPGMAIINIYNTVWALTKIKKIYLYSIIKIL